MPVQISCSCGRRLNVADNLRGKKVRCPDCAGVISVTAASNESASSGNLKSDTAPSLKMRPSRLRSSQPEPPASKSEGASSGSDDSWLYDDELTQDVGTPMPSPLRKQVHLNDTTKPRTGTNMLMPIELMLAVACIAVLGVLNLWQLASSDPAVWKIVAVIRLIVEARVVWGFWTQNRQTGIAATVAAAMMATVSLYLLLGPLRDPQVLADISREEQRNSRIYFCIQAIAEIGVIVCVNLPKSRRHLSVVENN